MTPFARGGRVCPPRSGTGSRAISFARALALVEGGRVALRAVEEAKIEATRRRTAGGDAPSAIEWAGGTGPARAAAGLFVRRQRHLRARRRGARSGPLADRDSTSRRKRHELDLELAAGAARRRRERLRARSVWPVVLVARRRGARARTLVLDSPRLRGVVRDAAVDRRR